MAVYTHITHNELESFLLDYDLGRLSSFEGIEQGVSNTNYHVFTDKGRYILTIFEEHRTRRDNLPYLFAYAGHLAAQGIPCPQAYLNKDGQAYGLIQGKAAALVKFLNGHSIPRGKTKTKYCGEIGSFLARMHIAAEDFSLACDNDLGKACWRDRAAPLKSQMDGFAAGLDTLIFDELDTLDKTWPDAQAHPQHAMHLDLFPDNVFFNEREKVSAMIDMYFAANDFAAFDLAIVANAWCFSDEMFWRRPAFRRLIQNYEKIRPLEDWEIQSFQTLCRGACIRFLLTRLEEWFAYDPAKTTMKPHDPQEYINKLKFHQDNDVMAWVKG